MRRTGMACAALLLAGGALWAQAARAAAPVVTVTMIKQQPSAGMLASGTTLATVRVTYTGAHDGFSVGFNAPGAGPGTAPLSGAGDSKLKVRLFGGEGWNAVPPYTIERKTGDNSVTLQVLVDGDQKAWPGTFDFVVNARATGVSDETRSSGGGGGGTGGGGDDTSGKCSVSRGSCGPGRPGIFR